MGSRGAGSGRKGSANNSSGYVEKDPVLANLDTPFYKATRIQDIKAGDEIIETYDTEGSHKTATWNYGNGAKGAANAPVIVTDVKATGKQVKIIGKIDTANFKDSKSKDTKWGVNFISVSKTFKPDEVATKRRKA